MRIIPDSTISLYANVGIDSGEQLVFKNRTNQKAYFTSKLVRSAVNCTMVRKTGRLRVEIPGSVISTCDYISFINPSFDNRTVYARIVDYDYINNECVEIAYAIDYWQTWMFDVTFDEMYIEREHLSQADWDKAELNPYDQSILEFKTSESLPISEDIEKPYYAFGTTSDKDGIFIGEALCNQYSITDKIGTLLIFSDINLEYLDTNGSSPLPSEVFWSILQNFIYDSSDAVRDNLCALKLSPATKAYLRTHNTQYTGHPFRKGEKWGHTTLGNITPFSSNTIEAPVSYVYCDNSSVDMSDNFSALLQWFTDAGLLDSLLGVYPVPTGLVMFSGSQFNAPISIKLTTAKTQSVTNKKLDLYPYSYYKVMTPNGDIKELRMESFKSAQDGLDECEVAMSLDVLEKPNLIIAPVNYKASGTAPNNPTTDMNTLEGIMFSQFPTMPYDIDAFRSQMAVVANSIIGNNTIQYKYDLELRGQQLANDYIRAGANTASGVVSGAISALAGDYGKAAGTVMNTASGGALDLATTMQTQRVILENEGQLSTGAYDVLNGGEDSTVYTNFKYTKPAYAGNVYHQVNGDGITNYNLNSFADIIFLKVAINPTILAQYDRYFTNFGYNSGRCGIPRVINYTRGVSGDANLPHWQTIGTKLTTYIKTSDCKVTHAMLPVAEFIRTMFNNGVRMIKGDLA